MNQITTQYVTEGGACYEQYVITDPAAKTALTITPERGGMITGFTLDGDEYIWTRRPNFSECNRPRFGVPVLFPSCGNPDGGVHLFDGKAYPMECHGFADLCAWEVESVGPDGVTLILESTPLTKFLYPFDFTLLVNYDLNGTATSTSGPAAPTSASATAPGSVCRCSSPAAATRTAASICSTVRPTPWSATASPTCAPGRWRASAPTV